MALLSVCENRNNLVSMKFSLRREAQVLKAPTGIMKGQSISGKKKKQLLFSHSQWVQETVFGLYQSRRFDLIPLYSPLKAPDIVLVDSFVKISPCILSVFLKIIFSLLSQRKKEKYSSHELSNVLGCARRFPSKIYLGMRLSY